MIYKLGELFCGPGGLAWGAINADIGDKDTKIIHAWANDIDNLTCQTYSVNICKNAYTDSVICQDVREMEISRKNRHNLTIFLFSEIIFLKSSRRKILFFSL